MPGQEHRGGVESGLQGQSVVARSSRQSAGDPSGVAGPLRSFIAADTVEMVLASGIVPSDYLREQWPQWRRRQRAAGRGSRAPVSWATAPHCCSPGGASVVLFESEQALPGASHGTGSKTHLGYLYSGDRGLHAAGLLTGGLLFGRCWRDCCARAPNRMSPRPLICATVLQIHCQRRGHCGYFCDARRPGARASLASHYPGDLRRAVTTRVPGPSSTAWLMEPFPGGVRHPEKSVCTRGVIRVAGAAVQADRVSVPHRNRVLGGEPGWECPSRAVPGGHRRWCAGPFTAVVNATIDGPPGGRPGVSVDNLYK